MVCHEEVKLVTEPVANIDNIINDVSSEMRSHQEAVGDDDTRTCVLYCSTYKMKTLMEVT